MSKCLYMVFQLVIKHITFDLCYYRVLCIDFCFVNILFIVCIRSQKIILYLPSIIYFMCDKISRIMLSYQTIRLTIITKMHIYNIIIFSESGRPCYNCSETERSIAFMTLMTLCDFFNFDFECCRSQIGS